MTYTSLVAAIVLATGLSLAAPAVEGVPAGWLVTGSSPESYDVGTAPQGGASRGPAAFIKSKSASRGFGTLMQMIQATDYEGKRVRFSANVRTEGVAKWSGLWMRVDGPRREDGSSRPLAFDNMKDRPIAGTTGWQRYEVVLDVPSGARALAYGLLVNGEGAAWMEDVRLETVSSAVAVTAVLPVEPELPRQPNNLGFQR